MSVPLFCGFLCIFSSARFVQLNGLLIMVQVFVYRQLSKVCEFRFKLAIFMSVVNLEISLATEWIYLHGTDFYVSPVHKGLRISSHIQCN